MKPTKKIIALLLATVTLVSSFAISASALPLITTNCAVLGLNVKSADVIIDEFTGATPLSTSIPKKYELYATKLLPDRGTLHTVKGYDIKEHIIFPMYFLFPLSCVFPELLCPYNVNFQTKAPGIDQRVLFERAINPAVSSVASMTDPIADFLTRIHTNH